MVVAAVEKKDEKKVDLNKDVVKKAVALGKDMLKKGDKTKADVARTMYEMLKSEDKEVVLHAFVQGAGLTEKGAVTYLYNIKRKEKKEKK